MIRIDSIVYDEDLGCMVLATDTETGVSRWGIDPVKPN